MSSHQSSHVYVKLKAVLLPTGLDNEKTEKGRK